MFDRDPLHSEPRMPEENKTTPEDPNTVNNSTNNDNNATNNKSTEDSNKNDKTSDAGESKKKVLGPDGRYYELTEDDLGYLAYLGLSSMMNEEKNNNDKKTKKNEKGEDPVDDKVDDTDLSDEKALKKTIDTLNKRLERMESDRENEKKQAQIERRKESISRELDSALKAEKIDDPKIRAVFEETIFNRVLSKPNTDIAKSVKELKETLNISDTYIQDKLQTRDKTRTARGNSSVSITNKSSDEPKFSAEDLFSGKIRKHAAERIRASARYA